MANDQSILVIEGEELIRGVLSKLLTKEGFRVFTSSNGQEGLKMAFENHPDLIMLDMAIPGIDGFELLKSLRADAWGKDASIIVMTNLGSVEADREFKQYGVKYSLVKVENTPDDIVRIVKEKIK